MKLKINRAYWLANNKCTKTHVNGMIGSPDMCTMWHIMLRQKIVYRSNLQIHLLITDTSLHRPRGPNEPLISCPLTNSRLHVFFFSYQFVVIFHLCLFLLFLFLHPEMSIRAENWFLSFLVFKTFQINFVLS